MRVIAVNAKVLAEKPDALKRFMAAYRETIEWMYADPAAVLAYAKIASVGDDVARTVPVQYYRKESLDPDRTAGLGVAVEEALKSKFIARALTPDELKELFVVPF